MQPTLERASGNLPLDIPRQGRVAKKPFLSFSSDLCWSAGGLGLLLLLWQLLAATTHASIVASPPETWAALWHLAESGQLAGELAITFRRLLTALALGSVIGGGLGFAAGFKRSCRALLEPVRWIAMTLPTVFIAVLGLLWFGLGDSQAVFLVTMIVAPVVYVNTLAGFDTLDQQLIEMARVYRFSRRQALIEIYVPGIGFHILTGLTLAAGIGVRAVLMAELLGASDGVGHSFNRAWTFLKTPEMFAWMLASLMLMALLEFGMLRPLRRRLARRQHQAAS